MFSITAALPDATADRMRVDKLLSISSSNSILFVFAISITSLGKPASRATFIPKLLGHTPFPSLKKVQI